MPPSRQATTIATARPFIAEEGFIKNSRLVPAGRSAADQLRRETRRREAASDRTRPGENRRPRCGMVGLPLKPRLVGGARGHGNRGLHEGRVRRKDAGKTAALFPSHHATGAIGAAADEDPEVLVD